MKVFLTKVSLFILPVIVILFINDYIITSGLQKSRYKAYAQWNDIFSGTIDADVIINGDSRAWVFFNPQIIDTTLKVYSYNFGEDSYRFIMQYYRYKTYRKYNKKPKFIIQTVGLNTLNKTENLFNYEQTFPYVSDSNIRKATKHYKSFNKFTYFLPYYRYHRHDKLIKIAHNEFFNKKHYYNQRYKGYHGHDNKWDSKFEKFKKKYPNGKSIKLDTNAVLLFDKFLSECKKEDIYVFLVFPPEYYEAQKYTNNRDSIIAKYKYFSKKYDYEYIDFSADTLSKNINLFYNSQHLNKKGSNLFSIKLSNFIYKFIETNPNILTNFNVKSKYNLNYKFEVNYYSNTRVLTYKTKIKESSFRIIPFFLHIYTKNNHKSKIINKDFHWDMRKGKIEKKDGFWYYSVNLPKISIEKIRTGQTLNKKKIIWEKTLIIKK